MTKNLLFSITEKDFRFDYYRASGPGGQNVNKVSSACRVTHIESGSVGSCQNHRNQSQNKKEAFSRCIQTPKFKAWFKITVAKKLGLLNNVEETVNKEMSLNTKVEIKDDQGRWIQVPRDQILRD